MGIVVVRFELVVGGLLDLHVDNITFGSDMKVFMSFPPNDYAHTECDLSLVNMAVAVEDLHI